MAQFRFYGLGQLEIGSNWINQNQGLVEFTNSYGAFFVVTYTNVNGQTVSRMYGNETPFEIYFTDLPLTNLVDLTFSNTVKGWTLEVDKNFTFCDFDVTTNPQNLPYKIPAGLQMKVVANAGYEFTQDNLPYLDYFGGDWSNKREYATLIDNHTALFDFDSFAVVPNTNGGFYTFTATATVENVIAPVTLINNIDGQFTDNSYIDGANVVLDIFNNFPNKFESILITYYDTNNVQQQIVLNDVNSINQNLTVYQSSTVTINGISVSQVGSAINQITGNGFTFNCTFTDWNMVDFDIRGNTYTTFYWYRFFGLAVSYTDVFGNARSGFLQISYTSNGTPYTSGSINDVLPKSNVTFTGAYAIAIFSYLTAATNVEYQDVEDLSSLYFRYNDTLNFTFNAVAGNFFDSTKNQTYVRLYEVTGGTTSLIFDAPLIISSDNTTATINLDLTTYNLSPTGNYRMYWSVVAFSLFGTISDFGTFNIYKASRDSLSALISESYGEDKTVIEDIIDCYGMFVPIQTSGQTSVIAGNFQYTTQMPVIQNDRLMLDFGSCFVDYLDNTTNDYHSTYELWLPFAGFVNVDSVVLNKTIGLQYVINILAGAGIANLYLDGKFYREFDIDLRMDIYYDVNPQRQAIGNLNPRINWLKGRTPFVRQTFNREIKTAFSSDCNTTQLNTLNGYCEVQNLEFDLTDFAGTKTDLDNIERLLNNGVIF